MTHATHPTHRSAVTRSAGATASSRSSGDPAPTGTRRRRRGPRRRRNGAARLALVLGLLSLVLSVLAGVPAVVAAVVGLARARSRRSGALQSAVGLALGSSSVVVAVVAGLALWQHLPSLYSSAQAYRTVLAVAQPPLPVPTATPAAPAPAAAPAAPAPAAPAPAARAAAAPAAPAAAAPAAPTALQARTPLAGDALTQTAKTLREAGIAPSSLDCGRPAPGLTTIRVECTATTLAGAATTVRASCPTTELIRGAATCTAVVDGAQRRIRVRLDDGVPSITALAP